MTDKEVMQMALDALECWQRNEDCNEPMSNILEALRTALAQPEPAECDGGQCGIGGYCKDCPKTKPEPEPVAWISHNAGLYHGKPDESLNPLPLYLAPPQREWVGLTDEEYEATAEHYVTNCYFDTLKYARAIEVKLKEKNAPNL
jgi:hypothetical protein